MPTEIISFNLKSVLEVQFSFSTLIAPPAKFSNRHKVAFYLFGKTITPPSYYLPRASRTNNRTLQVASPRPCPGKVPARWSSRSTMNDGDDHLETLLCPNPNLAPVSCSSIFFSRGEGKTGEKTFSLPSTPPGSFGVELHLL